MKVFLFGFLLLANTIFAQQQTAPINVASSAVPFLRISADARSGGMGETGIASSPDAVSGFHNLAKTPFAREKGALGITYTPWLRDVSDGVYMLTAAGYRQFGEGQAFSASLRYFNIGDLPVIDYNGNRLSTANPREWSIDLGYARKLSQHSGLGLAIRYINSDLASGYSQGASYKTGRAVAADVSYYYHGTDQQGQGWTFGVALSNLGSRISYTDAADRKDFIPASLGAGVGYTAVFDEDNTLSFTADLRRLLVPVAPADSAGMAGYYQKGIVDSWLSSFKNNSFQYNGGAEYTYHNLLFLRAGYFFEDITAGGRKGVTFGLGLAFNALGIDFSYLAPSGSGASRNPLSNTVRVGLNFKMNKK